MELVKIGSPELSTGAKKSSQVCDPENRVFGKTFQKIQEKSRLVCFAGVKILRGPITNGWAPFVFLWGLALGSFWGGLVGLAAFAGLPGLGKNPVSGLESEPYYRI